MSRSGSSRETFGGGLVRSCFVRSRLLHLGAFTLSLLSSENLRLLSRFALLARNLLSSSLFQSLLLDLSKPLLLRLVLGLFRQAVLLGTLFRRTLLLRLFTDKSLLSFPLLLLLGFLLPCLALLACLLFSFASLPVGFFLPVFFFLLPFLLLRSDSSLLLGLCAFRSLAFEALFLCASLTIAFGLLSFGLDGFGFSSSSRFPGETFLLELLLLLPEGLAPSH